MTSPTAQRRLFRLGLIPDWLDLLFLRCVTPIITLCTKGNVDPNILTVASFGLNIVASVFIISGELFVAGLIVGIAGILDFVDGKVAAACQRITKFGGILDSILDRYSDMVVFTSIAAYLVREGFFLTALGALLALVGASMTSYVKAISAVHGFKFRVGAVRRQERVSLICTGLLFGFLDPALHRAVSATTGFWSAGDTPPPLVLSLVIYALAVLTNLTALQRLFEVTKLSKQADSHAPSPSRFTPAPRD